MLTGLNFRNTSDVQQSLLMAASKSIFQRRRTARTSPIGKVPPQLRTANPSLPFKAWRAHNELAPRRPDLNALCVTDRLLNPKEREIVAYHEMGHALVALALPGVDVVHKVSIIPRGIGALGYTIQRPTEDRFLMTRAELENKMAVLLGGRAAELLVFDHFSTGAADDLRRVTDIARSMVTRYGMSEALGSVAYDREPGLSLLDPIPSCRMASTTMARQPRMLSTPRFERSSTARWRGHLASLGNAERSLSEPLIACSRRRLWTRLTC